MKNRYFMPLIAIASVLVLSLVTVASYAYFRGTVDGDTPQDMVITTGNMNVTYIDGNTIGTKENMIPGESMSKFFSVKNTGDVMAAYNIYLTEVANEFVNTDELVYELISEDGINIAQTECPTDVTMIASDVAIDVGATHNYELRITFLNTDYNQNDNQGTLFNAKISLEEGLSVLYKERTLYTFEGADPLDTSKDSTSIEDYLVSTRQVAYKKTFSKQYYTTGNTYFYTYLKVNSDLDFNTLTECEQTIENNYLGDDVLLKKCEYNEGDGKYYPYLAPAYLDEEQTVSNVFKDKQSCAESAMENSNARSGVLDSYSNDCEIAYGNVEKIVYQDVDRSICVMENGNEYCFNSVNTYNGPESSQLKSYIAQIDEGTNFDCKYYSFNPAVNMTSYICAGKNGFTGIQFIPDGRVIAGQGMSLYYPINLNEKFKTGEQCNATHDYCVYIDGYYYEVSTNQQDFFNSLADCNSALTEGKACTSIPMISALFGLDLYGNIISLSNYNNNNG